MGFAPSCTQPQGSLEHTLTNMRKLDIRPKIYEVEMDELASVHQELIKKAQEATYKSYAPYSHFHVGCAVLLEDGTMVEGANQENAAYPSGLCAERTALFHAGAVHPDKTVLAMAVAARGENGAFTLQPTAPCGACRQVMLESQERGRSKILILLYGAKRIIKAASVEDLLPLTFTYESLNG